MSHVDDSNECDVALLTIIIDDHLKAVCCLVDVMSLFGVAIEIVLTVRWKKGQSGVDIDGDACQVMSR